MRLAELLISIISIILFILLIPRLISSAAGQGPLEVDVSPYLPDNHYPWTLIKAHETNNYYTKSGVPRFPLIDYEINVSANIGGTLGTPLVDGDLMVIAGWEYVAGYEPQSGKAIWNVSIIDDFHATVASYALGDKVYVATEARFDEEGNTIPSLLLAFSRDAGELVWEVEVGSGATDVTSNLVLANGRLVFGTGWGDSKVYCFSTSGSLLWATQLEGVGNIRGVAVGGATVVVTGENGYNVYGLNLVDGRVSWVYEHDAIPGTPVYWDGKIFFIDSSGKLVCLDARSGKPIFEKEVNGYLDVDNNSRMAVSDRGDVFLVRREETDAISKYNADGDLIATYNLNDVDNVGTPVVSDRLVLLPVTVPGGVKLLIFWDDLRFINELVWETSEGFVPTLSVMDSTIYFVYALDGGQRLVKLFDPIQPFIKNIDFPESVYVGEPINVNVTVVDGESGMYKVVLFYRVGGDIKSVEMSPLRRYLIEPAGGYGLAYEPYGVQIPPQDKESTIGFRVLLVDNSGNYFLSSVYTISVRAGPQQFIWLVIPAAAAVAFVGFILWSRWRS